MQERIFWASYLGGNWDILVTALVLYFFAVSRVLSKTVNSTQRMYFLVSFMFSAFVGAWEMVLGPRPDVILISHGVPALIVGFDMLKKVRPPWWIARWLP